MISKERLDFEAWVVDWWPQAVGNLDRDGDDYQNHFLNYAWDGWQARSKQCEATKEPPLDDGWIPWPGGECPVPKGTLVDIRFRESHRYPDKLGMRALQICSVAGSAFWHHDGYGNEIVAYRVIKGE